MGGEMDTNLTRSDYLRYLNDAASSGTLLTSKHDPDYLATTWPEFRRVTVKPPNELASYIAAGDYGIRVYENKDSKFPPYFLEIIPSDPTMVAGPGVPKFSTMLTYTYDRFVAFSGGIEGRHIYAESSARIQGLESSGSLLFIDYFPKLLPST
jgi:hypothetical protein